MSVSYHSICQADKHHCTVCLSTVIPYRLRGEPKNIHSWQDKDVFILAKCKHLMHMDCFQNWQEHCQDLSKRDPSLPLVTCCPTCKTEVKKEPENRMVGSLLCLDHYCDKAETQDPKPSFLETSVQITPQSLDAVRPSMDEALSANNFSAMWQLKSRYGITLSAAQLKEVLWQSLPQSFHCYVTPSAHNKIRMALDLMTHDDASKWVVCDFLKEVLKRDQSETVVKLLVGSKMLSENALKETLNYFISKDSFDDAEDIKEQYDVSINSVKLKGELVNAYESGKSTWDLERILSLYDKDNLPCIVTLRDILKTVATQPQDYSPELLGQNRSNFFDNYMGFIKTLLSHGVEEQIAVDAAMTKAVSTLSHKGLKWAYELKTNYQAKMDPEKLRVAMDKAVDLDKLFLLELITPLFANGKDAEAAIIRSLERLASKPDQYFGGYRDAKKTLKKQLESFGCWSPKAVNTLIKRAVENNDFSWANELNRKYNAYLDPETLKNHILKEADYVKRKGHTQPDYLADLIAPLQLIERDNPGLPNAIQAAVAQICTMENFPLQQCVVDKLIKFSDSLPG